MYQGQLTKEDLQKSVVSKAIRAQDEMLETLVREIIEDQTYLGLQPSEIATLIEQGLNLKQYPKQDVIALIEFERK